MKLYWYLEYIPHCDVWYSFESDDENDLLQSYSKYELRTQLEIITDVMHDYQLGVL